jgi:integrase
VPRRPTVRDLLAWNEEVHVRHAESEKARTEMLGRNDVIRRYPLSDLEAEAVTVFELLEFKRARLEGKRRRPRNVRPDMVRLRAVFRAAKKKGKIASHVFETLEGAEKTELFGDWKPTPEHSKGRPIPADEWRSILAAFPEEDFNRTLRFLAATGCRLEQATTLDWSRYRELPIPGFDLKKQKKADRFVPLTPALRTIVGDRKASGPVFGGDGLYEALQRAWRYRVKGYRLHDIRHTVGTALRRSAGVENGASALGVTPAMMGIYGEHERDARNAAVLAAIQDDLGTLRATFPNSSISQREAK